MKWFCMACFSHHYTQKEIDDCPARKELLEGFKKITWADWEYAMKLNADIKMDNEA